MKILLIAHGELPIPPTGWGAVEAILWAQKLHMKRLGHTVDIANTRAIHWVVHGANLRQYDFVHCHNELFALECVAHLKCPFAVTSHHGGLYQFDPTHPERSGELAILFEDTMRAPANLVLSGAIRDKYVQAGYTKFLRVMRHGLETEQFRFSPHGNGKAICLGAFSPRKRQAWLAESVRGRVPVDFAGPWDAAVCPGFVEHAHAAYLGEWDRSTVYDRLTDYSCLTLLSQSEAAPRVVLEALAAGLSVVITEACAANLTDEPFITVLRDDEDRPDVLADAIQRAIDGNAAERANIRQYAMERFDLSVVTSEYLRVVEECRAYQAGVAVDCT